MIVWRGFGVAAFILGLLGVLAGVGLANATNDGDLTGPLLLPGLVVAGAATFALGWWLNVKIPQNKTEAWAAQRRSELVGQVAPSAQGLDPQVQTDVAVDTEAAQVNKQLRNNHTFFWIPMQWWGVVWAVLGLLSLAIPAS